MQEDGAFGKSGIGREKIGWTMKIIDIHTHCNCGSRYDVSETELHQRNFPFLMEEYANCGISAGGFSYFSALFSDKEVYDGNDLLKKQAEEDERVYQWLVLDVIQK